VEQAQARRWNDALIAKVEQERRKVLSADRLQARQSWRDLYLMSIVANRNSRTD
jgi:L-gulonate 3-dehydrogenase